MSDFKIPEGADVATVELEDCGNCASPTPVGDLAGGLCSDCQAAAARALAASLPPAPPAEAFTLPIDQPDELEERRARRDAVKAAAELQPKGWIQYAIEAARTECVRGRRGHEFTTDTIAESMEKVAAPMPEQVGFRYVMDEAVKRGWCEATERTQPSRREETQGRQVRVYRSCL